MMNKGKMTYVLKNSGFKDIATLSSGVIIAQAISFLAQPVATRLYSAGSFGSLSIIISIMSIITPIITLQYHMGIVTSKTNKEANVISALTFYTVSIMSFISLVVLFMFNILSPGTFSEAGNWIYMAIPLSFLTGLINIIEAYNNRFEQYKLMASVSIQRSLMSNLTKLILGIFSFRHAGLIISQLVSIVFGVKRQGKYMFNDIKDIFSSNFNEMKKVALDYKAQPLFSMPGLFILTFSYSVIPIFIGSLYSIQDVGYFSISVTILGLPLSLISNNVAKIFFRKASIEKDLKGNYKSSFKHISFLLILMSIIGFSILWLIAEPLFGFVYGYEWAKSGLYVKILIPMYAARFVVTSMMHGFIISRKQNLKLLLQSFFILSAVLVYIYSNHFEVTIEVFLNLINIFYTINYVVLYIALYLTSNKG